MKLEELLKTEKTGGSHKGAAVACYGIAKAIKRCYGPFSRFPALNMGGVNRAFYSSTGWAKK